MLNYFFLLQFKDYRASYEGYVPMKYKRYYKKMAKYVSLLKVISSIVCCNKPLNLWMHLYCGLLVHQNAGREDFYLHFLVCLMMQIW